MVAFLLPCLSMLPISIAAALQAEFPQLHSPELVQRLMAEATAKSLAEGEILSHPGTYLTAIPLVLSGSLKVLRQSEEGHDLFLYYLTPGQTCAMALSCCGSAAPSELLLVAEEATEVVLVPVQLFDALMSYPDWKQFVAMTYAQRFHELLGTIDSIAFQKMDVRLADYLETKARQLRTRTLTQTHQEIATELGTSREVISRLLKQMEKTNQLRLHRNRLELL